MWWAKWVGIPLLLFYAWFHWNYPTATFRYKLTAEVMTPDGLKTGSSVIEVSLSSGNLLGLINHRVQFDHVSGEAVYVDLGRGKNLFVLLGADRWERRDKVKDDAGNAPQHLTSMGAMQLPKYVYGINSRPGRERRLGWERDTQRLIDSELGAPPQVVSFPNIPMMGSFADLQNPETFRTLDPENINTVLGEGYALKQVTVQITQEPPTRQLASVLSWSPEKKLFASCRGQPTKKAPNHCRLDFSYMIEQ
jgi:hypothetical protein